MIKDFNRGEVKGGEVFHFQHSLRPFIWVERNSMWCNGYFIDIDEFKAYEEEDLLCDGFEFYTKDDDEDFKGVEVEGKIEWVDNYNNTNDRDNDISYDSYMGYHTGGC